MNITASFVQNTISVTMLGGLGWGNFLQSGAGEPNGVVTPQLIGAEYIDTTNGVKYYAQSLANTSRVKISYSQSI